MPMELNYAFVCSFALILSLTASSTTAEKAQWLVKYNKTDKKFELNKNALSKLELLPKPVKVISAIGEARVGKSTTLNFVRHIWDCNEKHEAEIEEVFKTGDSTKAVTYGIWISVCKISKKESIVLLDVEGTNLGNDAVTSHMSVFTSLMSSGIVVFSPETIKNDILDFLYGVTRLSEHIFKGIDENKNFGHLHIAIRGALSASEETFEDTMRNAIVEPSEDDDEATNNKRRAIAKYFLRENIRVSEIPLIANRKLLKDSKIKKNGEYWNTISLLSQSFKKFPDKMTLGGNQVDGKALVKIARTLIEMMNKNSWLDFSDNYLTVEKYLCDKSFQVVISPAMQLKTSNEIEQRKESVLKTFRDECALTEEVNKADIQLRRLIFNIKDKEEEEAEMRREAATYNQYVRDIKALLTGVLSGGFLVGLLSDVRLKEKVITLTPSKYEALGVREVRWTWNKQAEKIGLHGEARGVVAQEVEKLYPWAVVTGNDGYKRVLYTALEYVMDSLQAKRKEDKPANKSNYTQLCRVHLFFTYPEQHYIRATELA